MKIILQDDRRFLLRFDKDEELVSSLTGFLEQNNIQAAGFSGIGSCSSLEIGYYNAFLKDYRKKPYMENFEIVSLNGNAALLDGKPAVHMHGVFGRNDFTSISGHVFKLAVGATCEIFLIKLDGEAKREHSQDFNLNLLA
ncbi:MAG: DNA-binding protein [Patescibacteria group bacterium]|nr:DNA-binding protein [Patescibacteria group bacterium]